MIQNFQKISIIMPCYNEEKSIPSVVPRMLSKLEKLQSQSMIKGFEFIVVDDKSTDRSAEMLQSFSQVKTITTPGKKRGYGHALKTGFSQASGDWVAFLDMDNSYRPEDLKLFLDEAKKGQSDFIMGKRSFSQQGMSLTRGLGNWIYKSIAKLFYGSSLEDVCSGYRFFHKKHLKEVLDLPEQGLDFSIHLTMDMLLRKIPIKQVPIQYDPRLGESKLSVVSDGLAFLKVLLTVKWRSLRAFKHSRV